LSQLQKKIKISALPTFERKRLKVFFLSLEKQFSLSAVEGGFALPCDVSVSVMSFTVQKTFS
jgi:hypothetical protein